MSRIYLAKGLMGCAKSLGREVASALVQTIARFEENPAHPSLRRERVNRSLSEGVWAARVNQSHRLIHFQRGDDFVLIHVDKHDAAYLWAERHRVEVHPATGAIQIWTAATATAPVPAAPRPAPAVRANTPPPFGQPDEELLSWGIPPAALGLIRAAKSQEDVYRLLAGLPDEAGENLVRVCSGEPAQPRPVSSDPLNHPDASGQIVPVPPPGRDADWIEKALAGDFASWMVSMHPEHLKWVDRVWNGPYRFTGAAGTGKTVLALRRAVRLADSGKRVLLTTYTNALVSRLRVLATQLAEARGLSASVCDRITVSTVHKEAFQHAHLFVPDNIVQRVRQAAVALHYRDVEFAVREWNDVVARQGLTTKGEYLDAARHGRGAALSQAQREDVWPVFERVLSEGGRGFGHMAAKALASARPVYDAVLVDEAQNLNEPELRLLFRLCRDENEFGLFQDSGQRIWPGGFSLASLGIDVQGRAHRLQGSYRNALGLDAILKQLRDPDADSEGGVPVPRIGPPPPGGSVQKARVEGFEAQNERIVREIRAGVESGLAYDAFGVVAPRMDQVWAVSNQLSQMGVPAQAFDPDQGHEIRSGKVLVCTLHSCQGLEFETVFIVNCTANLVPNQNLLNGIARAEEREAYRRMEKNRLYAAVARARRGVRIYWTTARPSPFLEG